MVRVFAIAAAVAAISAPAFAAPVIGQTATAFQAQDDEGKTRPLSSFEDRDVRPERNRNGDA